VSRRLSASQATRAGIPRAVAARTTIPASTPIKPVSRPTRPRPRPRCTGTGSGPPRTR
jgi:hypothetical protein